MKNKSSLNRLIASLLILTTTALPLLVQAAEVEANAYHVQQYLAHDSAAASQLIDSDAIKSAMQKYQTQKSIYERDVIAMQGARYTTAAVYGGLAIAAEVGTAGLATPLILGVVGYAANEGMSLTQAAVESSVHKRSEALLYRMMNSDQVKPDITGKTPEQAFAMLAEHNQELQQTFQGMDAGEKAVVTQSVVNTMADSLAKYGKYQANVDALQDVEIASHGSSIKDLSTSMNQMHSEFSKFAQQTNQNISDLASNQKEMQAKMNEIQDTVARNSNDLKSQKSNIDFLNQVMFSKMSASEQRRAIQLDIVKTTSETEKKELLARVDIVILKEKIESNVAVFMQGSELALGLANKLKINPKVINAIAKTSQIVGAGSKAVTAFMTGNYLGAATAIFSLFGGGRDIAAERHQQILDSLNEIKEGQAKLMEGINDIKAGINALAQGQVKIYQAILDVSVQIEKNHREVMTATDDLSQQIMAVQDVLNGIANKPFDYCDLFINHRADYGFSSGRFASYQDLKKHFDSEGSSNFYDCVNDGLKVTLENKPDVNSFHSRLLLRTYAVGGAETTAIPQFIKNAYKPTLKLFEYLTTESKILDFKSSVASLQVPMTTWEGLLGIKMNAKLDRAGSKGTFAVNVQSENDFMDKLMSQPLATFKVKRIVDQLLEIVPYFSFLDRLSNTPTLLDERDLAAAYQTNRRYENTAVLLLTRALGLLELNIAQQNLVSGDRMLTTVEGILAGPGGVTVDAVQMQKIGPVINGNPLFARNLATLFAKRRLKERDSSAVSYRLAYSQTKPDNLKSLMGGKYEVVKSDSGNNWVLKIQRAALEVNLPLPQPDELAASKWEFINSSDIESLVDLKAQVASKILDFNFERSGDLTDAERQAVSQLIAKH